MASSLINALCGKGVTRDVNGQECRCLPVSALLLMIKVQTGISRAGRQYNKMDDMDKSF